MKKNVVAFFMTAFATVAVAQNTDPVVMKINGKDIKLSEFEYIYNKNNNENAIDKRALDEYLTLFCNFKLSVAEAEAQGLDTTATFRKELDEYHDDITKSYLSTAAEDSALIDATYRRANEFSEISALFVNFPQLTSGSSFTMTPADTVETYNKVVGIRNQALKKGVKFEDLVKTYSYGEQDKTSDRPGYIGWMSGMRLAPILELALANTPVGKISAPIRTPQGYYLIKIHDRKKDLGEVHAAHILLRLDADADTVQVADVNAKLAEIQQRLKAGDSFAELAKEYSQDTGTAQNGGDLSWFGFGQMVSEFNTAVYALKDSGDVSLPVKTRFGYHLIQLLGKRPDPSLAQLRHNIEDKLESTGYLPALYQPSINELKAEYGFQQNAATVGKLQSSAQTVYPTDSLFLAQFGSDNETLFTVQNQPVKVSEFIAWLQEKNPARNLNNILFRLKDRNTFNLSTEALQEKLDLFTFQKLIDLKFNHLMQEYRDGILLFAVKNNDVWEKAQNDTEGLEKFFAADPAKYAWDEPHWKGYIVLTKDAKAQKKMQKAIKNMSCEDAAAYLKANYVNANDSLSLIKIEKGLFTKGQSQFVDEEIFKTGKKAELPKEYAGYFLTGKYLPDIPESYADVKGLVVTDYQDYLEVEWLKQLNAKYPIIIYRERLEHIK